MISEIMRENSVSVTEIKDAVNNVFIDLLVFKFQGIFGNVAFWNPTFISVIFQIIEMVKQHSYRVFLRT